MKQFQIGLVKNAHQISVHSYGLTDEGENTLKVRIMDVADLEQEGLELLLFNNQLSEEEQAVYLNATPKSFPLACISTEESDWLADPVCAEKLLAKYSTPWALRHNLSTLEEIFGLANHLSQLWSKDRTSFIEELWFLIKSNLAANEVTLFFHDVLRAEKEHEKDRLVWAKAMNAPHGRHCEIVSCNEIEIHLVDAYKNKFVSPLEVVDADPARGQYTWAININKSPILVMLKTPVMGALSLALIKALINGLQAGVRPASSSRNLPQPTVH